MNAVEEAVETPAPKHPRPTAAEEAARARLDAEQRRAKAQRLYDQSKAATDTKARRGQRVGAMRQSRIARALDFYAHGIETGAYPWGEEHIGKPSPFEKPAIIEREITAEPVGRGDAAVKHIVFERPEQAAVAAPDEAAGA